MIPKNLIVVQTLVSYFYVAIETPVTIKILRNVCLNPRAVLLALPVVMCVLEGMAPLFEKNQLNLATLKPQDQSD
jgi:hypothetical protein